MPLFARVGLSSVERIATRLVGRGSTFYFALLADTKQSEPVP
jgi:hypothetical protein